jgi:hypothetical protein
MIRYDTVRYDLIRYYIILYYIILYYGLLQLGWNPVALVNYTFTQKEYTEQHNETEYTEYYILNNKDT